MTVRKRLLSLATAGVLVVLAPTSALGAGTFQAAVTRCWYDNGSLSSADVGVTLSGAPPLTRVILSLVLPYMTVDYPVLAGTTDATGSLTAARVLNVGITNFEGQANFPLTLTAFADVDGNNAIAGDPQIGAPVTVQLVCPPPPPLEDVLAGAMSDGSLSGGEASSLLAKVDAAGASVDRDNIAAAIRQLEAFIAQVRALTDAGRIAAATSAELMTAAQTRIAELRVLQ